jgi:urease accessory protein
MPVSLWPAVIARALAVVAPGGVLREVRSEPPLTLRRVHAETASSCALCLVGSAAGPLGGDELALRVDVLSDARATVRATGAQLAQGRDGSMPSRVCTELVIGERASLAGDTGPLVVAAGAATRVDVSVTMADTAHVEWKELLVLGRSGEAAGRAWLRWDVTRSGRPVLRQSLDLTRSPDMLLAGHRVLGSCLLAGPGVEARTVVLHESAVASRLAPDAVIMTVFGPDAVRVADDLATLCGEFTVVATILGEPARP